MAVLTAAEPTTQTVEVYRWSDLHGMGFSFSSSRSALVCAGQLYYQFGCPPDPEAVLERAAHQERVAAGGRVVGLQDLAAIIHGEAVEVRTSAGGGVVVEHVGGDPLWLSEHALVAYEPRGTRHSAPGLLEGLFDHPRARDFVGRISELGARASEAYQRSDPAGLARAVGRYVDLFSEWTGGRYVNADAHQMASRLGSALGGRLLAWKPPGAGSASSLAALVDGPTALGEAVSVCRAWGWVAAPVALSEGLTCHLMESGVTFTAPLRLDWVGAADLGADPAIGVDGTCFGIALEPRNELVIRIETAAGV